MKTTIQSISFSFNHIEVSLSGINYTHFINPNNIDWFSIGENNQSIQHKLEIGSVIEFDITSSKTRNLENVKFSK